MEAQSYTAQERRAANQVWAAAGEYGFEPLFLARNTDGTVDFYMNCSVGLVHKYYGDKLINSIFDRWAGDLRQAMLDDLAWLYLENAAYRLELPRRPVLEALRDSHADYFFAIQYKLSRQEWMARNQLVYTMQAARWRSVLGRNLPVMTPLRERVVPALAPDTAPQPDQLTGRPLAVYATFDLFDGTVHPKAALHLHLDGLLATLATKTMPTQMIKTDRMTVEHSNAVDPAGSGPSVDKRQAHITLKQNAAQDRAYIESCFGRSLYPPERLRKAEQELCTGDHLGCHLWFASGVPSPEQAPTPEARHLAEQAELQADRNRAYDAKNRELHRSVVLRLTEQIRNCILVHQQPNARVARSGNVDAGRIWRAPLLNDDRVFLCAEEENHPAFTVDLLLDASASRLHCQEVIAAQGSILAESLANCGIPVRVSAFSSLRGYTVLRVLKDFADKNRQNINRYFASGWNRDGLALLAAGDLLDFAPGPAPRHLLILLTDAPPMTAAASRPARKTRWAAATRTLPVWLTLPRRCVLCSARASGCRLCSWVRTAPPPTLPASMVKIWHASAAWTNWLVLPGGSSRTRSGNWAIERDCLPLWGRLFCCPAHNRLGHFTTNRRVVFWSSSGVFAKIWLFLQTYSCFLLQSMLYYVQTNHRNARCPPQCTAAARVGSPLNTTLCCQLDHSGRNVSWMPTATLPPCTTPCHPVCRGAASGRRAPAGSLRQRRLPGSPADAREHCATVCYSTMGRRGLNFQLFRKGWMLCHNESGQLTGQFPAKAESLLEDTDFHACCREDRLDAARTDRMVQELETLAGTDCDLPLPRDARTGAVITVDSFVGGVPTGASTLSKAPLPAGGRHPVLAGRQPGRSRAPHPAGRPGGCPAGRTVAERHGGDVLPPGRTGCRPAADAAPDPAGEPSGTSGTPGPHLRPHQKLAEHSGRHGEHVKRLPLAGEPF